MTAIIRAAAAHDLLALVPMLAGFRPERSLLCVAFVGNRTAGVLRHDLPSGADEHDRLVAAVIGTVCRIPDVDAIVPVVYTDERFAETGRMPRRDLLALVVERAGQAGFLVRDALCQADDGWASLLDPDAPETGRPLAMIESSGALATVPDDVRLAAADDGSALPPAAPERARAIEAALAGFRDLDRIEGAVAGLARDADPVELVESMVARARRRPLDPRRTAWLLHLASRPVMRDAMMLQIAFGRTVGELAHDASIAVAGADDGCASAALDEEHGLRGPTTGAEHDLDVLARLIIGSSMLRPEPARVERGLTALREAIAHAPARDRPGALCIAAWLAWALGRGSVAGAFLDAALEIDPDHTMANLLDEHIGSGALPEWAFSRAASTDEHFGAISGP